MGSCVEVTVINDRVGHPTAVAITVTNDNNVDSFLKDRQALLSTYKSIAKKIHTQKKYTFKFSLHPTYPGRRLASM